MKLKVIKEVEVTHIKIDVAPRYIGDGEDYDMPSNFPMLDESGKNWVAIVEIATGKIFNWSIPEGSEPNEDGIFKAYIKVCDAGIYSLLDDAGLTCTAINGYVPNGIVPGEYGDYIDLEIDFHGRITNWPKNPSLEDFENFDDD